MRLQRTVRSAKNGCDVCALRRELLRSSMRSLTPAARARRQRVAQRRRAMAPEALALLTPFVGPDTLPADCYSDAAVAALLE